MLTFHFSCSWSCATVWSSIIIVSEITLVPTLSIAICKLCVPLIAHVTTIYVYHIICIIIISMSISWINHLCLSSWKFPKQKQPSSGFPIRKINKNHRSKPWPATGKRATDRIGGCLATNFGDQRGLYNLISKQQPIKTELMYFSTRSLGYQGWTNDVPVSKVWRLQNQQT